jgi:lysophospholipase L1-like esterase
MRRLAAFVLLCSAVVSTFAADKLELADGDRVVLLGNTFVERDVQYGYLETALTLAYKDKNITFRNLGWSGDTVWGHARAGFGSTQDGYNNMIKQVKDAKPSALLLFYGMSESFDGESGLAPFIAQYEKLLNDIADTKAKLVIVSPIRHEKLGGALPDSEAHNAKLEKYVEALRALAAKRGAIFVSLFDPITSNKPNSTLTDNGIHPTEQGFGTYASLIASQLAGGKELNLNFDTKLRTTIVEKNTLFFHRWRPQNDTYIFGFRKHEQGRNAVDIPKFDPLVEAKEKEIAAIKAEIQK